MSLASETSVNGTHAGHPQSFLEVHLQRVQAPDHLKSSLALLGSQDVFRLRIVTNSMASQYLSFVVMALLLGPAFTALVPPVATADLANKTGSLVALGVGEEYPECFPPALFSSRLAESRDCLHAVMMLPTIDDIGFFNSDGARPDQFVLPLTKIYRTCNVTVSIAHGVVDECSWSTISNVAGQLVQTCSAGYYPNGKSGGITVVGKSSHIRLAMGKIGHDLGALDMTDSAIGKLTS